MNHLDQLDIRTGGDLSDVYRPHVARLTDPQGRVQYLAHGGLVDMPQDAIQFTNRNAAASAGQAFIGFNPHAFWESERRSAALAQKKYRGWRAAPVPA